MASIRTLLQHLFGNGQQAVQPDAMPVEPEAAADNDDIEVSEPVHARVTHICRSMHPLILGEATLVTFTLKDGTTRKYPVSGEGGWHVLVGDEGVLTVSGSALIAFEKPNGEVIGGMYYIPAEVCHE